MQIRIVKQYNHLSPKNGIVEVDFVEVPSVEEAAQFVTRINANKKLDFEIVDYDTFTMSAGNREILENPTGGYTGKLQ